MRTPTPSDYGPERVMHVGALFNEPQNLQLIHSRCVDHPTPMPAYAVDPIEIDFWFLISRLGLSSVVTTLKRSMPRFRATTLQRPIQQDESFFLVWWDRHGSVVLLSFLGV